MSVSRVSDRFRSILTTTVAATALLCATHEFAWGAGFNGPTVPGSSAGNGEANLYRIHRGDTIQINFPYLGEFNQTESVQPDGTLILKTVGSVQADGLTLSELHASVVGAYSTILRNPLLTIQPLDLQKPYFTALGSFARPGKYDLKSDLTVSEAIAMAGGFNDQSKQTQVVLFRKVNDQMTEARLLNFKKMLNSHDMRSEVVLQPGDMLFVPKNRISKIARFLPTQTIGAYTPF
jgi:polysaccharide export outer membrane protein